HETVQALQQGALAPQLAGDPETAGKAIEAVADMLTTKAPELAVQQLVEQAQQEAQKEAQKESEVKFSKPSMQEGRREIVASSGPKEPVRFIRETGKGTNVYDVTQESASGQV